MLRGHPAAVPVRKQLSLGNAEQRVVCLVHFGAAEEAVVGCDERQRGGVGKADQRRFHGALDRRAVAVQFDHRSVGECFGKPRKQAFGFGPAPVSQQAGERAGGAAGQQDQARCVRGNRGEAELRLQPRVSFKEAKRGKMLEIVEPACVLCQEHDRVRGESGVVLAGERHLAADDGLNPPFDAGLAEFHRAEQVGGVRDGNSRHTDLARQDGDFLGFDGALAERVGGMDPKMDEIGVRHGVNVAFRSKSRSRGLRFVLWRAYSEQTGWRLVDCTKSVRSRPKLTSRIY